ncbi:hypothetical protein A0J61_03707 [Choanephora cucurbitarum]|uniref:Uncharacterized protein n=1 Tax=Choanephora cucurbitarum TaxID=101091 RepID=A0A1C7NI90_9FUNG|nr:hypothetical protein A0J61_03707 [Choanephora cucurbitarum]
MANTTYYGDKYKNRVDRESYPGCFDHNKKSRLLPYLGMPITYFLSYLSKCCHSGSQKQQQKQ